MTVATFSDVMCYKNICFFSPSQFQMSEVANGWRLSNSSSNSHTERITHTPLVLGEQFSGEMQPEFQVVRDVIPRLTRRPLESPTAQAEKALEKLWHFKIKALSIMLLQSTPGGDLILHQ